MKVKATVVFTVEIEQETNHLPLTDNEKVNIVEEACDLVGEMEIEPDIVSIEEIKDEQA